jgi:hypothetical protein
MRTVFLSVLAFLFLPVGHSWAQGLPDPTGVRIDSEGVMRTRTVDEGELAELRKRANGKDADGKVCYISLPQLFAEAKAILDKGEELPDRIRFLGGMVKLQYVFIYPDENDLVIAGPCEPFEAGDGFRPLGQVTGRPVLHLDDLVTALRVSGPQKDPVRIGCDIEVDPAIAKRCSDKIRELRRKVGGGGMSAREASEQIAEAGGKQPIVYYTLSDKSRFAYVCAEADYLLKHLALGLIASPVKRVRSYNQLSKKPGKAHRFSLETLYDAIVQSEDGNAFELNGNSLEVKTGLLQRLGAQSGSAEEPAQRFVDSCNRNFPKLALHIESWSDLANLADLTVLAALIGKDSLHSRVDWDLGWVMSEYPVSEFQAPKYANRLCNYKYNDDLLLFTSGGIWLDPVKWVNRISKGDVEKPAKIEGSGAIVVESSE